MAGITPVSATTGRPKPCRSTTSNRRSLRSLASITVLTKKDWLLWGAAAATRSPAGEALTRAESPQPPSARAGHQPQRPGCSVGRARRDGQVGRHPHESWNTSQRG